LTPEFFLPNKDPISIPNNLYNDMVQVTGERERQVKEEKVKYSTVDEFVNGKVLPEFREVVELIRGYMCELAPDVQEMISYGIPAYKGKRILAIISPTKKDITFAFSRGAQFEDKYSLLKGVGKSSKHIKFKNAGGVNKEVLEYYIKQALEFDLK
jgi:hypothetical protein